MIKQPLQPVALALSLSAVTVASFLVIGTAWQAANGEMAQVVGEMVGVAATTTPMVQDVPAPREKPLKQVVKGVYLTAYSAGNPKKVDEIINLIDRTELNAVVMDIKDYSGLVLFDTKVPLANKLHLKDNRYKDLASTIKKFHDHNIYVIARQTVFQDPVLAERRPELAIKNKQGGVWRDHKGLSWVDATKKDVWDYNVAIARDAIDYGFDEVNFDYVRFPSDGNLSQMVYSNPDGKKYVTMGKFYQYLGEKLDDEPAWISIDMFGFVMDKKGEDDMNIGQRLTDALGAVDYICPMMYPSHYPVGYLGLKNPAASPGIVLTQGLKLGAPRFTDQRAELRPWIQAFNMGAVYDAAKIREQIATVEKYPNAGWLLWNAANRYTAAGLKPE